MAVVKIQNVRKFYGSLETIKGVSIDVPDGDFVVLVVPSGCGKSTLLRMIAGLEDINDGEISIGGEVVNDVEPKNRDIAMVFQNYALYPHMTVEKNMGFSLRLKKTNKEELFDDIIYRRFEPILVMQEYYTDLESYQFKDSNERARFIVLYVILEYVKYVNSIVDSGDYRDKVKHYLLNPLDNKDLLVAFTIENYPMKDFVVSKIKQFEYLVDNIFKVEMTTKEKLEIKKEYNRVLNENLLDNLKKTNENINRIQPYIYSVIIVIIAMIIIYLIVTAVKKP